MINDNEPSVQLLEVFIKDLKIQVAQIKSIIDSMDDSVLARSLIDLNVVAKIIHSISKLVGLSDIESLVESFESFIEQNKEKIKNKESIKDLIQNVYTILFGMSEQKGNTLISYLQEKKEKIEILKIRLLQQDASESVPQEQKAQWTVPDKKMIELFQSELESQIKILSIGLLNFQHSKNDLKELEPLMRAAHSIKGAAKVFFFDPLVQLAHAMEDCFVAAQAGKIDLDDDRSEVLFQALDSLGRTVNVPTSEIVSKISEEQTHLQTLTNKIHDFLADSKKYASLQSKEALVENKIRESIKDISAIQHERVLKLTAQNLNRLMGLAAESMVETRWLRPFCDSLLRIKISFNQLFTQMDFLKTSLGSQKQNEATNTYFQSLRHYMYDCQNEISERVTDLEMFISRHSNLTDRLYSEVIESRMRPFDDGVSAYPRMVWETARHLKKKARLEITGRSTLIDRDILEKLEAPLGHLLRNAVDHGIEFPDERIAKGKPPEGLIKLDASHKSGMLSITVCDDGRGIDIGHIKSKVVNDKMLTTPLADNLSEQELIEFIYLPGFSTSKAVTDVSGRGMGLNVVQNMLQEVSGNIFIDNQIGKGTCFHMQLPLTLSVSRALIVRINQGIYGFPLARIEQAITVPRSQIEKVEKKEYINFMGNNVGLVPAGEILGVGKSIQSSPLLSIVILRNRAAYYGIVVDEFLGEKELVLQELESRLGKIPCVSSGSVMENGDPVLIVDVEDVIGSTDKLLDSGLLYKFKTEDSSEEIRSKKRILVVDDSISVREVECRLLSNQGYIVDSSVNGADAWNAVRLENYDLVVTDVDMPRMNGIELVKNIKNDARLHNLPVMIVSYKERESDRIQGLEAGADYYLAKSTFGDEALINVVKDLIGDP